MSSEISEQSLTSVESKPATDETTKRKKRTLSFWRSSSTCATSDTKLVGEEDKGPLKDVSVLGQSGTENREEIMTSHGTGTMGELSCLSTDQPLSDEQLEAIKAAYKHVKRSMLDHLIPTLPEQSSSDDDDEEAFQNFLSVVTDKQKFTMCLNGDPEAQEYVQFYKMLNSILHADNIPSFTGELTRFYNRRILSFMHAVPNEEKHSHLITYYAKGAHLVGLQSRQLLKYILPKGYEDMKSPYSKRPSLNSNQWLYKKTKASPKIQNIRSTKSKNTVKIENRIRQLTVKREGVKTKEMVTPVKVRVHLKVKSREALTYDDINQIRNKAKAGLNSYLSSLTRCKRCDTLQSWGSLHSWYNTLSESVNFLETFSTYSWSWSGRRNMVEIWELVETEGSAAPPPSPFPACTTA